MGSVHEQLGAGGRAWGDGLNGEAAYLRDFANSSNC